MKTEEKEPTKVIYITLHANNFQDFLYLLVNASNRNFVGSSQNVF